MNKKLLASAFAGAMLFAGNASAAPAVVTFDESKLVAGSTNMFDFDELLLNDVTGTSFITQTDADDDGTLDGDTFFEIGLTGTIVFSYQGDQLLQSVTGVDEDYELLFDLALSGTANADPVAGGLLLTAEFGGGSTMDFYHDTDMSAGIQAGATLIATLGAPVTGGCAVLQTPTIDAGACDFNMQYTQTAAANGLMTYLGDNLEDLIKPVLMNFDINVDELDPGFAFNYPGYGATCGSGSDFSTGVLCSQLTAVSHNGSGRFFIPEPGSLALLGLGLLGLAGASRKKAAK